jgi:phytoene desaturase
MGKKVLVVGAGPGGLTAGMILASKGYDVEVFEKDARVGGRNQAIELGPFKFDTGPTFLMLLDLLELAFREAGRKAADYLDLRRLDPLYRLRFHGKMDFFPRAAHDDMVAEIARVFPGDEADYDRYFRNESAKYDVVGPCLEVPYDHFWQYLRPRLLRALPRLDAHLSVYDRIASYFKSEELRLSMTFQAKYLGMSPWRCPATFTILPLIEHKWGVYHPIGGLNAISEAMAKVLREEGGVIHLNRAVKEVVVEGGRARGLVLADGERRDADAVVVNADFAWAMSHLVDDGARRRYRDAKLKRMGYSCSTFMLYLGLDRLYDIPHHNVFFAEDYHRNLREISETGVLSEDPSFYLQNACVTDPTLAPKGQSTLYVLAPVPNNVSGIDWAREKAGFRERLLAAIERKTELTDLRKHIVQEKVVTPADWQGTYHCYNGATFNLAHTVDQMLYFRPHNRFDDFKRCYIVGGGTHPGSGLPTIYMSGKIAADLLQEDLS